MGKRVRLLFHFLVNWIITLRCIVSTNVDEQQMQVRFIL